MHVLKYKFGENLIYEINELNNEVFETLGQMVDNEDALIRVCKEDFETICKGYKKLMIGFGYLDKIDDLLSLFDLYKDTKGLIVIIKKPSILMNDLSIVLSDIRDFFTKDINIIFGLDKKNTDDDYEVIMYLPIIEE